MGKLLPTFRRTVIFRNVWKYLPKGTASNTKTAELLTSYSSKSQFHITKK